MAPLIALLLAFLISAIFVRLAGKSPLEAGQSLFQGATGLEIHLRPWHVSFYAGRLAESLAKTIPLIMTGLSVAVAFRAGFFNIGAEGQFLMGALVATALGTRTGAGAPLLLVVGALAGAVWSLIAGVLKTWRGAPEIITTIMLNYIALQIVVFAVQGPLQERVEHPDPQTDMLPLHAQLSPLMPNTTLHSGLIVALVCAVACWWLLYRTERGFLFRAVGAGPVASQVHGINVERNVLYTVALSGAMAGLGGAMEIAGVTKYMVGQGFDYGYTAIAVALLAGLDPLAVVPAALLFGMLNAGGGSMERNTGVPAVTVSIIAGIIICLIAAIPRLRRSLNTVA